jgi:hypothetical protein
MSTALAVYDKPEIEVWEKDTTRRNWWMWVLGVIVLALVVLAIVGSQQGTGASNGLPAGSTGTTATATWKMVSADHGMNRWFLKGIDAINTAKTPAQARKAANDWLEGVKRDPALLAGTAKLLLKRDVDKASLVDSSSMATTEAVGITGEIRDLLDESKIVPDNAPATGYNTGVTAGSVVRASNAGITGDRKAIQITTPDGRVFWVLGRCGNVVTPHKPSLPPGETDNHKDPSKDPYPRGNAPTGGGKNLDPGPGTYIPPTGMVHPPASPRVNPPAPKPTAPPAGSKPDPTPAPAPEPTAPTPDAPATGYSPAPGT